MEPGKQNRRTRNSLVIKTGTGKSWRILLTVLIMKKTGLKTIEAFSWLFCQYPCSIFIQEFTPAFSFLLVASSFDTATLDHLRPETYTRQQYYCGGSCMRSAARQPPVTSCGLCHGLAHLLNSTAGKASLCLRSPIEFVRFYFSFFFFIFEPGDVLMRVLWMIDRDMRCLRLFQLNQISYMFDYAND